MPSVHEIVRAKNVDMLVHQYNAEVKKINSAGFINTDSKEVKALRNKYENLIARFDTDKNTVKKEGKYLYKLELDSEEIQGLKGINKNIKIGGK